MDLVYLFYFILLLFSVFLLILFLFLFHLDLDKEYDVISFMMITQVTKHDRGVTPVIEWSYISQVTQSHDIKKNIENSNNVI